MSATGVAHPQLILVPIDLSKRSEIGIDYAAMLAREFGARLVFFTNISLPERAVLDEYAKSEDLTVEEAAATLLQRHAAQRAEELDVTIRLGKNESPAEGILAIADELAVDMIVLATHGRTGMSRWLLGSVAERISRSADIPVVIVPARTS